MSWRNIIPVNISLAWNCGTHRDCRVQMVNSSNWRSHRKGTILINFNRIRKHTLFSFRNLTVFRRQEDVPSTLLGHTSQQRIYRAKTKPLGSPETTTHLNTPWEQSASCRTCDPLNPWACSQTRVSRRLPRPPPWLHPCSKSILHSHNPELNSSPHKT